MAGAKVLSGARAVLGFYDPSDGKFSSVGIFSDVSFGVTYDLQPAWVLGRYSAAELDYTAMEIVHVTANGYRIVSHGWFADARFPSLSQLMDAEPMTLQVLDRQTGSMIARIDHVRPVGATGGYSARQLSTSTHTYQGLLVSDESQPDNAEGRGAMSLP
jgi:hypothetical protein